MNTKICSKCGELKDECEFNTRNCGKSKTQAMCRSCQKEYFKSYYNNPEIKQAFALRTKEWRKKQKNIQ